MKLKTKSLANIEVENYTIMEVHSLFKITTENKENIIEQFLHQINK